MDPIVIIGAGMAAYSLAREFRKLDKATPLTLVAADAGGAYAKPMLSNAFALGKEAAQLVSGSAARMAEQLDAQVLSHTQVLSIDTARRAIHTASGTFAYSRLVLALGAGQAVVITRPHAVADTFHTDWATKAQDKLGLPVLHLYAGSGFIGDS